jgi:hypothetical protein
LSLVEIAHYFIRTAAIDETHFARSEDSRSETYFIRGTILLWCSLNYIITLASSCRIRNPCRSIFIRSLKHQMGTTTGRNWSGSIREGGKLASPIMYFTTLYCSCFYSKASLHSSSKPNQTPFLASVAMEFSMTGSPLVDVVKDQRWGANRRWRIILCMARRNTGSLTQNRRLQLLTSNVIYNMLNPSPMSALDRNHLPNVDFCQYERYTSTPVVTSGARFIPNVANSSPIRRNSLTTSPSYPPKADILLSVRDFPIPGSKMIEIV